MKPNKKFAWCAPVALICALMLAGCDTPTSPEKGPGTITWTLEQEGGVPEANDISESDTTAIIIKFSAAVDNLIDTEITIGDAATRSTNTLSQEGNNWIVPVTVSRSDAATVTVTRNGVATGTKAVKVYKANQKPLIGWSAIADGTANTVTSTKITFTFDEAVTGLTANDITLTNGTGSVTTGTLTGSGTNWILNITVTNQGEITVAINKTGISETAKPVAVHQNIAGLPKSLHVTGLNSFNGKTVMFLLFNSTPTQSSISALYTGTFPTVYGENTIIQNNMVTISLKNSSGDTPWTGTGSQHVVIVIFDDDNDNPPAFYVSTSSVTFNAATVTRDFSDFKQFAFRYTFAQLAEWSILPSIPSGGMTLDELAQSFDFSSWQEYCEFAIIRFYTNDTLTAEFDGSNRVFPSTGIYTEFPLELYISSSGPKIGEITGTITLTNIPSPLPTVYISVYGNDYVGYDYWSSRGNRITITGVSNGTASNLNWSIPVYESDNFVSDLECYFSLYVVLANNQGSFQIEIPSSHIISNINQNVSYLGSVSLATVTLSGTINVSHNGGSVPRVRIDARDIDTGVYLGSTELSSPATTNAPWSMVIPAPNTSTTVSFSVSGYTANWDSLFDKDTGITRPVSNQNVQNIVLDVGNITTVTLSGTISVTYNGQRVPNVQIEAINSNTGDYLGWAQLSSPLQGAAWSMVIPTFSTSTTVYFSVSGWDESGNWLFSQNTNVTRSVSNQNVPNIVLNLGNITP